MDITNCCESQSLLLHAIYLAGYLNIIEDQESREEMDASYFKLSPKRCMEAWDAQLDKFITWKPPPDRLVGECSNVELVKPSVLHIPPPILSHRGLILQNPAGTDVDRICLLNLAEPTLVPPLLELNCDVPLVLPQSPNLL